MRAIRKVVVAIDSFKGSLDSVTAGEAAATGIRRALPEADVTVLPLADGGEGTAAALVGGLGGAWRSVRVTGPTGRPVSCAYGILPDGACVLEIAGAAGITLVPEGERNPLRTTTFGVGEVLCDALDRGCRRFVVGIGGSATNDAGAGMLQALGFALLDAAGEPIGRGGGELARVARVSDGGARPELAGCSFRVACDVTNPLCGPDGASAVFGPQKGATPAMVAELDAALDRFARLKTGRAATCRGDGAAGGLGFAFRAFLGAELVRGVELVLAETGLAAHVAEADAVVTGEGRLDAQTAMGKAPIGVAGLAKRFGKPVIAFSGCVAPDAGVVNAHGIDAFFPIPAGACSLAEAMDGRTAAANLARTAEQAFRWWARAVRGEG